MRVWTIAAAVGALMAPPAQANETRVVPRVTYLRRRRWKR